MLIPHPRAFQCGYAGDHGLVCRENGAIAIRHRSILTDCIDNFHSGDHTAERRILTIQMGRFLVHDEELRTGAVVRLRARHGQNTALVRNIIGKAVCRKFALNLFLRTAHAVAHRIAALNHETLDDAVKSQTIIEALIHQLHEVCNGDRRGISVQLSSDRAIVLNVDLNIVRRNHRVSSGRSAALAGGQRVYGDRCDHQYHHNSDCNKHRLFLCRFLLACHIKHSNQSNSRTIIQDFARFVEGQSIGDIGQMRKEKMNIPSE